MKPHQRPRRNSASTLATPSRIQAKRRVAKNVVYADESSDEIAASVSDVPIRDKDKGKKRRRTDSEDPNDPVTEIAAPKRRKVETKKGVYRLDIPVHVHVPRRRLTTPTQSNATSNDAMDVTWNDNVRDGTTEASEAQTSPPFPAPKSKQRPRRSGAKTTITIPSAPSSYIRTRTQRAKAVPGSPIQGPPTPPSDTPPALLFTTTLLPASNQGVPPFDPAAFKSDIRAEVTAAVAAQFADIREEIFTMRAIIERLGQNSGDTRLAEIEMREAALTAKEEEYERLKSKETGPVEGLAALDTRYREMEQELMERFATKERQLLEKASRAPLQNEQVVQGQVDISADHGTEEMELLVLGINPEELTDSEVSIRQVQPLGGVSQAESIEPLRVLEAADSEEVTFQEALMATAVETVGDCLPTDKVDQGLDSGGDVSDGWQISATAAMVSEDHVVNPRLEMIPSAHGSFMALEAQTTPGSLPDGPTTGCAIDPRISAPTSPPDSDVDAEADNDSEAIEDPAFATPTNEQ